jgi:hypothetical protein
MVKDLLVLYVVQVPSGWKLKTIVPDRKKEKGSHPCGQLPSPTEIMY